MGTPERITTGRLLSSFPLLLTFFAYLTLVVRFGLTASFLGYLTALSPVFLLTPTPLTRHPLYIMSTSSFSLCNTGFGPCLLSERVPLPLSLSEPSCESCLRWCPSPPPPINSCCKRNFHWEVLLRRQVCLEVVACNLPKAPEEGDVRRLPS